jgi:feruloyl-CoA synthase
MNTASTKPGSSDPTPRYRPLRFGITRIEQRESADGIRYIRADQELEPHAERITDRLLHWARTTPDRVWMAQRAKQADGSTGDWRTITYAQALEQARSIGQALLDAGLNQDRPVAILSENDLEHAVLALACLYVGVPYCPISPAYSTVSQDFEKLRHVVNTITPGLVYAADAQRYRKALAAIAALESPGQIMVLGQGAETIEGALAFDYLVNRASTAAADAAQRATDGNTIAKFLFTSGSTKLPKGVINTHGMWCANQQQMRQSMPVLTEEDIVLVDWLPWNHTFGGNHNYGMVLYNGGTLYIDDGKPTPGGIAETLRNLREIAPTMYFNVPTGFEAISHAMQTDEVLRRNLLSRVKMFFYSGAALAQPIWDRLHAAQESEVGERIVMGTGLGMTESSPFAVFVTNPNVKAGHLGVPTAGMELKLVPTDGKLEIRYRGPNITPGYWRNEAASAEAFDDEGFFKTGDAVLWIDPENFHLGLKFDGRIAEDFKLATGTFVSVGPLRAKIIAAGAPYVQDAVITGLNLKEVGALIIPTARIRELAQAAASTPMAEVLATPAVQAHFQSVLDALAADSTGSANRVARLHVLAEAPSIDRGEITDKGSINQRAVLAHRAALVDAFHEGQLERTLLPR